MAKVFRRHFSKEGLRALEAKPGWWTDLLAYRFLDFYGQEQSLVIAIRNGYLNAYVEGQSILMVKFDTEVKPAKLRAEIHYKFVLEAKMYHKFVPDEAVRRKYFYFDGEKVTDKSGKEIQRYAGRTTLDYWVSNAQKYSSLRSGRISEKQGVAVVIAGNTNVIDVEMALPRNDGAPPVANRIDMVGLQDFEGILKIVFYEAKIFSNASLRKLEKNSTSVIMQTRRYEDWLQGPGRVEQVLVAYRETCRLLIHINEMREHADRQELHPHIFSVAKRMPLELDMEPRLLIFDYEKTHLSQYWSPHELKLSVRGISDTRLLMVPQVQDVRLPQAEPSVEWSESLGEAEAILLDMEGPEALAEVMQAARRNQLADLARFSPIFTAPGFVFATWREPPDEDGVTGTPYIAFSTAAEAFLEMAYRSGWVVKFNWSKWKGTKEAKRLVGSLDEIANASFEQLQKLLTIFIRGERFYEGELDDAFDGGHLTAITQRAAVLRHAMP